MTFLLRTKVKNIFRSILFNEIEQKSISDDGTKMVESIIKKGKRFKL